MNDERTTGENSAARKLLGMLRFAIENFGPVIVFMLLSRMFGTKIAIGGTVAYTVLDIGHRLWKKQRFTTLYLMSAGMTVGFGIIDLLASTPFMLRFEPVITNLVSAGVFVYGAFGKPSMVQELVEQKRGSPLGDRPDLAQFFVYLTLAWAAYFVIKSGIYLWVGLNMPLDRAIEVRSIFGTASLVAMIGLLVVLARPAYFLCERLRLIPPRPQDPGARPATTV